MYHVNIIITTSEDDKLDVLYLIYGLILKFYPKLTIVPYLESRNT